MNNERYIAALEISSSKIIGAVGRARPGGQTDVLAIESEKSDDCVHYGIIQNLEEAAARIRSVISKLESKPEVAPRKIRSVYVGLSGLSLHSVITNVDVHLPEETEITDSVLDTLRDKALTSTVDSDYEVIDAVPRSFKIGKLETTTPKGSIGQDVSATYDLIVCRREMCRNISRTLPEKLGIRSEGFIVTGMATGHILLSDEEKRLGCMLVDIGAETSTISIYRYGHLQFFATLPLGGRNITRDLTSLNMLEQRAEEIKRTSGNAIASENPPQLNLNGLKLSDVSNIIVARSEEIVTNIIETISHAGLKENDLPGGIVCIGGGSKLNGMLELIANKSNLPVRRGQLPSYVRLEDMRTSSADSIQVASILYEGATLNDAECLEMPQKAEIPVTGTANAPAAERTGAADPETQMPPKPRRRGLFDRIKHGIGGYFRPDDEDDSDLY